MTSRKRAMPLVLFACGLGIGGLVVAAARMRVPAAAPVDDPPTPVELPAQAVREVTPVAGAREASAEVAQASTSPATADGASTHSWSYDILPVTTTAGFGVEHLYVFHAEGVMPQAPTAPGALRPPNDQLQALDDQNRFGDLRGPGHFMHLGSDYASLHNAPMVPPTDDSVLVAAAHVEPYTYVGVGIDMSGSIQMYAVTVETGQGAVPYLICYAHLSPGSNEAAMAEALANGGRVATVGTVAQVGPDGGALSDFHIAVIDVARLYEKTGEDDLEAALVALFTREMPRTNQKYPEIFVRPEDVMTALERLLVEG